MVLISPHWQYEHVRICASRNGIFRYIRPGRLDLVALSINEIAAWKINKLIHITVPNT